MTKRTTIKGRQDREGGPFVTPSNCSQSFRLKDITLRNTNGNLHYRK
jgi:hypothetical protein